MSRRTIRTRTHSKVRFLSAGVDYLEVRQLLSTSTLPSNAVLAHPTFQLSPNVTPSDTSPPAGAFTPAQIAKAYGFNKIQFGNIVGDGTGQTIGIVDAYDAPNIQSDLNVFDTEFNLPATTITKVDQNGGTSFPTTDPTGDWEIETSLDVEWAHAMAPGANILLVEANTPSIDLYTAVNYASAHSSVVSMSWVSGESPYDVSLDSTFQKAGVVFVAASGDNGSPISYPASSPNVLSVGGTSLFTDPSGVYQSESGWNGSGGGPSAIFTQPAYQKGVVTQTTTSRANPDVSYDADPYTGFAIYDTTPYYGTTLNWLDVGGTSAGTPQWAALVAIADQGRTIAKQPLLNATSPQEVQTILYNNNYDFHDITTGGSSSTRGGPSYLAGPGYDYVTGLGSPYADRVAADLSGQGLNPNGEHLVVSAPTSSTAGVAITVTVSAYSNSSTIDTGFLGTVVLNSNDPIAGTSPTFPSGNPSNFVPVTYTFTPQDNGVHTFTFYLRTSGADYISATDALDSLNAHSKRILVSPASATKMTLTGIPTSVNSPVIAGTPETATVSFLDPFGNVAAGFTGTVQLTTSDPIAYLYPPSYTFKQGDAGTYSFLIYFETSGTQTLKASTRSGFSASLTGISVIPSTPYNLVASPASSTSMSLSWSASSGASRYIIQRSLDGTTWTQVGLTSPDTTAFTDKGLLPGTTYSYRVQAAGGAGSGFSKIASATTTGVTAAPAITFWSNSYIPNENSYSSGDYEVGMKFFSTVAGTVTGLRFYKQAYMGGYLHVGHLWTANGTLLASASFTSESYSGWQQVTLATPVAISANTNYIVSFSSGGGRFGMTTSYFSNGSISNGSLTSTQGSNGFYAVGGGNFPTVAAGGLNFWADVAFAATTTQPSVTVTHNTTTSSGITSLSFLATSNLSTGTTTTGYSTSNSTSAPSPGITVLVANNYPYRQTVNQALVLSSSSKLI